MCPTHHQAIRHNWSTLSLNFSLSLSSPSSNWPAGWGLNPPGQNCKLMETCQENLDHYQLKHCQNQIALFTMRCTMQFQNCTKTGLTLSTQNFVYSKRHSLRFVLESILRNQRPNFEKTRVKSQLGATCVENAGSRRSRICDSVPLSLRVHTR